MRLNKDLEHQIDWDKISKLPSRKQEFYQKLLIKNNSPDESELAEERRIREVYVFLAGVGIAVITNMLIGSLYRLVDLSGGFYIILIHFIIFLIALGFLIYLSINIIKKIESSRNMLELRNNSKNQIVRHFLEFDGLLKKPPM